MPEAVEQQPVQGIATIQNAEYRQVALALAYTYGEGLDIVRDHFDKQTKRLAWLIFQVTVCLTVVLGALLMIVTMILGKINDLQDALMPAARIPGIDDGIMEFIFPHIPLEL